MASTDYKPDTSAPRGAAIPISIGIRRHSRAYGRMVGWLKLVLPTIAILLVAIVILWPFLQKDARQLGETMTNASALISEHLQVSEASYSGVGEDGQRYTVTAQSVEQDSLESLEVNFTSPRADVSLTDGSWVLISSEKGWLNRESQILELTENVNLFHDLGYEFRTESATFDLVGGSAFGFSRVEGQGPFGAVEAEGFEIQSRGAEVRLTGKAKVIIYDVE